MIRLPLITSVQALVLYHQAYNNELYRATCDAIAATQTPHYPELVNLLTDAALEACGYPAYHGVGWTLAYQLHQYQAATPEVLSAIETYLAIFRREVEHYQTFLQANPEAQTVFLVGGLQMVVDESVRVASQIPSRYGSAVYHLLGACSGLLQIMSVILQYQSPQETSPYNYAAEKFQRALRDMRYALSDLLVVRTLPPFFQNAHDRLRELLGD